MAKNKNKTLPVKQNQPQKKQKNSMSVKKQLVAEQYEFAGPLPHPAVLAGYENIQKGFADRIITLAEQETKHRHEMDKKFLDASVKTTNNEAIEVRFGQFFGLIIGLTAIIAGSYTAVQGATVTG